MSIDKKYKLYVFDLDGTLADTKTDIGRALQVVLKKAGFDKLSEEEVVSAIGGGAKKAIQKLTALEGGILDDYAAEFMQIYDGMCCDNVTLYEGAGELLRRLKQQGAVLALVTMKFKSAVEKILKKLDIDIFDEVIAFEDAEKRKPHPDSLFMMLEKYDAAASETLMVGDSMTDLKYANAAGVDACIMKYGYANMLEISAEKPAYLINSFLDFEKCQ